MARKVSVSIGLAGLSGLALCLGFPTPRSIAAEPGANPAGWNRTADVNAIRAIEDRLASLSDPDRLAGSVADDAILVDAYLPAVNRGKAAVLAAWRRDAAALGGGRGHTTEISVITTPSFACSASQIRFAAKAPASAPAEYRKLDVFRKIGGHWQLIQQHLSAAIDRKSGMVTTEPLAVRGPLAWDATSLAATAVTPSAGR